MNYTENIHYSLTTENSVLGALLMENDAYESVMGILTNECFYNIDNKAIYSAIQTAYDQGNKIDVVTISDALHRKGIAQMNNEPIQYHLATKYMDLVNTNNLTDWAYILREKYAKRKMLELSYTVANPKLDPFEASIEAEKLLEEIFDIKDNNDWKTSEQVGRELMRHMDEASKMEMPGVATGIQQLDKLNGGFRKGDLIVIGARPSVGKSAFMGLLALHIAKLGKVTGIISLEMKDIRILARTAAIESEVPHWQIDRGRFEDELQKKKVIDAIMRLSGLPIYLSQSTRVTVNDIKAKARKLHKKHGLEVLFIDYLQLIEAVAKDGNREQQVSAISRGLKVLAMDLDIPIILLAQLNRESEKRADKRPILADLRESGAIEQDADVVMLLHRDWHVGIISNSEGASTKDEADLFIPKWRDGTTTQIKLGFDGERMRFYDPAQTTTFDFPEPAHKTFTRLNNKPLDNDKPFG